MTGDGGNANAGPRSMRAGASRLVEPKLKRVDLTGRERQLRGAMQAMSHVAQRFARSAKRSLPFLVKRRARIVADAVAIVDLGAERVVTEGPIYEVLLGAGDSPAWGLLTINAEGLSLLLEGVLGGDGATATSLGAGLT